MPPPDTDPSGRQDAPGAGTDIPGGTYGLDASTKFYNDLLARLNESEFFTTGGPNRPQASLFESNRDRLINEIIPKMAASGWANNMPAFTSNNPWYGAYLLASALTGTPFYNPDSDLQTGVLQYIPGYQPQGAASTLARGTHGTRYWWLG